MMSKVGRGDWRGRRVLVTGGTGFIGVNLADRIAEEGAAVSLFARHALRPELVPERVAALPVIIGDITDVLAVQRAFEVSHPDVVFHLASTPFNPPGTTDQQHQDVIVGGTANVIAMAASDARIRFVHTGSGAEYGAGTALREDAPLHPATGLGVAKSMATALVQRKARDIGLSAVILRLFTPYGPWDHAGRLITHSAIRAGKGDDIQITDGRQQRDFVYVADVVDAFLRAATAHVSPGSIFNICSGEPKTVREVAELALAVAGRGGQVVARALPTRPDEIWELSGDNGAAERELGWHPTTEFRDGFALTYAWIQEHVALYEEPVGR